MIMPLDEHYMRRALDLAAAARGYTEPNPLVGAVIVARGRIIGEGYHQRAGDPHAEIMALSSVSDGDRGLIPGSTVYVTLEPCSHMGKTPPCADRLVAEGIGRVVVAIEDPFPKVAGRGIARLRAAGIEVLTGVLRNEAEALNEVFLTVQRLGRPFVTLKWAESADGFIDRLRNSAEDAPILFSTPLRRRFVHRLRARNGAVLVGAHTAVMDAARLDCRFWPGRNPLRIVLSRSGNLEPNLPVFTANGRLRTLVVCPEAAAVRMRAAKVAADFFPVPEENDPLRPLLGELLRRGIHSLLVEGGSCTLQRFLDAGLYDRIEIERSPLSLGNGVPAPRLR